MSKYTMRIKEILENYYEFDKKEVSPVAFEDSELAEWENPFNTDYVSPFNKEYPTVDQIIDSEYGKIFDFDFPKLPDVEEGTTEKAILKAYYMREIGFETVGRFKLALNQRLNQIMPYYVKLAESEKLQGENPLENYNLIDHSDRHTDTNGTNTENGTETSKTDTHNRFDDTPSSELSFDTNYATSITDVDTSNNTTNNSTFTNKNNVVDTYDRNAHGIMGFNKQELLSDYRKNILNINEMIIREVADLFMLIY